MIDTAGHEWHIDIDRKDTTGAWQPVVCGTCKKGVFYDVKSVGDEITETEFFWYLKPGAGEVTIQCTECKDEPKAIWGYIPQRAMNQKPQIFDVVCLMLGLQPLSGRVEQAVFGGTSYSQGKNVHGGKW